MNPQNHEAIALLKEFAELQGVERIDADYIGQEELEGLLSQASFLVTSAHPDLGKELAGVTLGLMLTLHEADPDDDNDSLTEQAYEQVLRQALRVLVKTLDIALVQLLQALDTPAPKQSTFVPPSDPTLN